MFTPPRCPHRSCSQHTDPNPGFFVRHGYFKPKCRAHAVPRFRCRTCGKTFSRQTFRSDYRDHRPSLNPRLFLLIASGVGLRQSARLLKLSRRCTELKFRKIARHLRRLNLNLRDQLDRDISFHLDEIETFEGQRNARPLSVPVMIESESRYIVWAESATIRPRGTMTAKRLRLIARSERRHGKRKDLSRRSLQRTFQRAVDMVKQETSITLLTDEKSSYPGLAARAFGSHRVVHRQTNSKLVRDTFNPLFPINHEEALMRDLMGRLRRESWLVSKSRRYLDLALHIHMAFRNLVRTRFNRDRMTPAQMMGFVRKRLTPTEVLSWRQDWGRASIHPVLKGASENKWHWSGTAVAA